MAKRSFLVPVALSLAALAGVGPAGATLPPTSQTSETVSPNREGSVPVGNLVLERATDQQIRFADHSSHSSHASHSSHSSHASHSSGGY